MKPPRTYRTLAEIRRMSGPDCDTLYVKHRGQTYSFYLGDTPDQQKARFEQLQKHASEEIAAFEGAKSDMVSEVK